MLAIDIKEPSPFCPFLFCCLDGDVDERECKNVAFIDP